MISRIVRALFGIWLATGLATLTACSSMPGASNPSGTAPEVGSSRATEPVPEQHFSGDAPMDKAQSQALTDYLHTHQLPLVGARVLADSGTAHQVILYGFVATPFGRADAADRSRDFLKDSNTQIDNRIKVEPELAGNSGGGNSDTSSGDASSSFDNPDVQRYQDQQQQAQQQQYLNQSPPSGLIMMMPLLGMFSSFGGGGSGFGFGAGTGMSPSPYGTGYGYPPPGYGYGPGYGYSPYGP